MGKRRKSLACINIVTRAHCRAAAAGSLTIVHRPMSFSDFMPFQQIWVFVACIAGAPGLLSFGRHPPGITSLLTRPEVVFLFNGPLILLTDSMPSVTSPKSGTRATPTVLTSFTFFPLLFEL